MAPIVGMGAATYSVVRYRVWIVALYVLLAIAAGVVIGSRRGWPAPGPRIAAVTLLACGLGTWVPTFSYVPPGQLTLARTILSSAAVLCAALVWWGAVADPQGSAIAGSRALPRRRSLSGVGLRVVVLAVALAAHVAAGAITVRADPHPQIDVWYTLQGAADALAEPRSWYSDMWIGVPGPMPAFTYLPGTVVLLAPWRWLFGDVRWGLIAAGCLAAVAISALPAVRPRSGGGSYVGSAGTDIQAARLAATGFAASTLMLPGTITQLEQAWTEPLLFCLLALAAWAWHRGLRFGAALALGLGLGSKQHLLLLIPLLVAWPAIGPRRALAPLTVGAAILAPWFLTDPGPAIADTLRFVIGAPAMRFADTVTIAVLNETGIQIPFWVSGPALVGLIAAISQALRRNKADLARLSGACALVLLLASLLNKQGFYNQYWLCASLWLLALGLASTNNFGATTDSRSPSVARGGDDLPHSS